jgi:asparagine synthase (glutamine-hydrolysing)
MAEVLKHRGPDGRGVWISASEKVGFSHTRLAILDLSESGHQPMMSRSGRFAITFNGEIYNHLELRERLGRPTDYLGHSDTETILACIEAWGVPAAVRELRGMFAIGVWDSEARTLWLTRDRLGEKPLYYASTSSDVVFASEVAALEAASKEDFALSANGIASLVRFGYIPAPLTPFQNIAKLFPGELAEIRMVADEISAPSITRYWSFFETAKGEIARRTSHRNVLELDEELHSILLSSVREQVVADVPVGAFLSGGIDSSLVVALMQTVSSTPVRSFTITFDGTDHDEGDIAREVADILGTTHTEIPLEPAAALQLIERLPSLFSEPFADSSQLPSLLVASETRKHVTVALSGDGGDELFGGYTQYLNRDSVEGLVSAVPHSLRTISASLLTMLPSRACQRLLGALSTGWPPATLDRLITGLKSDSPAPLYEARHARWPKVEEMLRGECATELTGPLTQAVLWLPVGSRVEKYMAWDTQTYLPDDILVKVDRTAMAASLETRAPLLDYRVVTHAWKYLPAEKMIGGKGKLPLRRLLAKYAPSELFDRPKRGFSVPLGAWLRGPLRQWAADMLAYASRPESPVNAKHVAPVLAEHLSGKFDHSERLWTILVLLQWYFERPSALKNTPGAGS